MYIEKVKPVGNKGKVITRQGVLWRINKGLSLPLVSEVRKVGKQYVVTVKEK